MFIFLFYFYENYIRPNYLLLKNPIPHYHTLFKGKWDLKQY